MAPRPRALTPLTPAYSPTKPLNNGTWILAIPYADAHERHVGDLFLPARPPADTPPVLLVHGGSWCSMPKEALLSVRSLVDTYA